MDEQIIISINREYGSGGHIIAEMLAKEMELPLYDRNLLDELAKEKGIDAEHYEEFDEKPHNPMLSRSVRGYSNSFEKHLAEMQFEFLNEKAESGESFVIVGRCSETVLKEYKGLISIFVLADRVDKVARIQDKYGLSQADALAKINRHDRHRKFYHNSYSSCRWGDSRGYDLCVNSSRLGIEGTAEMLKLYIEKRMSV